jgi:hypothetical protein
MPAGERFVAAEEAAPPHNPDIVGSMQHVPEKVFEDAGVALPSKGA